MNEVESRIDNQELFNKFENKIESQLQPVPIPSEEYIFLATLALYYLFLWYITRKWFPDGKV